MFGGCLAVSLNMVNSIADSARVAKSGQMRRT